MANLPLKDQPRMPPPPRRFRIDSGRSASAAAIHDAERSRSRALSPAPAAVPIHDMAVDSLNLSEALSCIMQQGMDKDEIQALRLELVQKNTDEQNVVERLRAQHSQAIVSLESTHEQQLTQYATRGQIDAHRLQGIATELETHHAHMSQQLLLNTAYDSTQARHHLVASVRSELEDACVQLKAEFQLEVQRERLQLNQKYDEHVATSKVTLDEQAQSEFAAIRNSEEIQWRQQIDVHRDDRLSAMRHECETYAQTEFSSMRDLRLKANEFCASLHDSAEECEELVEALGQANDYALAESKAIMAWQEWGDGAQQALAEATDARRVMKAELRKSESDANELALANRCRRPDLHFLRCFLN